jgi:hypothetical protein
MLRGLDNIAVISTVDDRETLTIAKILKKTGNHVHVEWMRLKGEGKGTCLQVDPEFKNGIIPQSSIRASGPYGSVGGLPEMLVWKTFRNPACSHLSKTDILHQLKPWLVDEIYHKIEHELEKELARRELAIDLTVEEDDEEDERLSKSKPKKRNHHLFQEEDEPLCDSDDEPLVKPKRNRDSKFKTSENQRQTFSSVSALGPVIATTEVLTETCIFCSDDKPLSDFRVCNSNLHKSCVSCIEQWLEQQFPTLEATSCGKIFHTQDKCNFDVARICKNKKWLEDFEAHMVRAVLGEDMTLNCVNPDCGQIVYFTLNDFTMGEGQCTNCMYVMCLDCKQLSHPNERCAQKPMKEFKGGEVKVGGFHVPGVIECPHCGMIGAKEWDKDQCLKLLCPKCKNLTCGTCWKPLSDAMHRNKDTSHRALRYESAYQHFCKATKSAPCTKDHPFSVMCCPAWQEDASVENMNLNFMAEFPHLVPKLT